MRFIKHWKPVLLSITTVALFFIVWDVIFTQIGVWGFNEKYHLPYTMASLPLEEIAFFFCIPYACIFIHYSVAYFKPNLLLSAKNTTSLTILLIAIIGVVLVFNYDKLYTYVNYTLLIFNLSIGLLFGKQILQRFYISFAIILIPFFIVNGILTGSFITEAVVWYDNTENLGIRLGTIPIEDIGYAFNMLFMSVFCIEKFGVSSGIEAKCD